MPEGPEIRLAADEIARVLEDRVIVDLTLESPSLKRFRKKLLGQKVEAVETRGKAMLTRFDNGLTLYSHNQLYGRWYTTRRPERPETARRLRIALHTDTHSAWLYSATEIAVLTPAEVESHPFLCRLGPDVLGPGIDADAIAARLGADLFCGRSLGSLYLDQAFLAGIGNYLRSEILWSARLDPRAKPAMLSRKTRLRLARETLRITRRSYRTRGLTVPPTLARELRAKGGAREDCRFHVFGREGLPCYACGSPVERGEMGSRGIFVCPRCQAQA